MKMLIVAVVFVFVSLNLLNTIELREATMSTDIYAAQESK